MWTKHKHTHTQPSEAPNYANLNFSGVVVPNVVYGLYGYSR